MNFYMANVSRHDQGFNYRLPEKTRPFNSPIKIGQQILIGRNWGKPECDAMVAQVETYGGVRVGEYEGTKGKVITFLYDMDREIPRKEIERVMRHNSGQLTLDGKEMRKQAAIATMQAIEALSPGEVEEVDLTIQEETAPAPGEKQIAEGILVHPQGRGPREGRRDKKVRKQ